MNSEFVRKIDVRRDADRLCVHQKDDLLYLSAPMLDQLSWVRSGFSTRMGGVSTGQTATMNLSFARESSQDNVRENFARIAGAIGVNPHSIVCSAQTHTTNVQIVSAEDAGCGVYREKPWHDIDALVTDAVGVTLAVFMSDCVPLLVADPVHHAIGAAHSGWRGTIGDIAGQMLKTMHEAYGTQARDVICAIGPSICGDCYEVSVDVAQPFIDQYGMAQGQPVVRAKGGGKYLLDLWQACRINFLRAGVPDEAVAVTDICTHCNPDLLFSHRTQHGQQGNLGAFIAMA